MRDQSPWIAHTGQAESSPYLPEDQQKYAQPHAERIPVVDSPFDDMQIICLVLCLGQCLDVLLGLYIQLGMSFTW